MSMVIKGLRKRYTQNGFELLIPTFSVLEGETVGIVGNNGAGKSTFLKLVVDLLKRDEGVVSIFGFEVGRTDDWKSKVGAYLDNYSLIEFLTVEEYFELISKINGIDHSSMSAQIQKLKHFYDPSDFAGKKTISQYSTGNKQKIGIVGSLLSNPRIVLLDEPFANLDPTSQLALKRIIRTIQSEYNTSFLISSPNLDHIVDVSDRIVLFEKGRMISDDLVTETMMESLVNYFNKELIL
jgi:ABC-2 type transport system ATP-binding protein